MWIFGIFSLFCVLPCSSFFLSELLWTDSSETEKRGNETTDELKTLKQQNATFNGSIDLIKNADNFTEESNISREQSSTSAALTVTPPGTNTTENITENTIEHHDTADREEEQKAEERMHIEYIKRQLMAKLRLSSAPVSKSDASVLPLAELGRGFLQTQHDQGQKKYKPHHFYAKALQIYVIGNDETENCSYRKSAGCYYFDVNGKVPASDVQKAELWIYKLFYHRDPVVQTFVVSELGRTNRAERKVRPRNIINRFETKIKHGWLKIDVTETVVRWLQKPARNDGISILCKGCQRKNHKTIFSSKYDSMPFLAITTRKSHRSRRSKRSAPVACSLGYEGCCLAPLEINFDEIGWTGIIAPKKLNYAYCKGSCNDEIDAHSNHSKMVQEYRYSNVATDKERREMTPCCAPISFSAQSMLIRIDSTVIHQNIPNLIPTACGCL